MWNVNGQDIKMTEGDFGVSLPITINGVEFSANDAIKLTIKTRFNGDVILEKEFTNIQKNTVDLILSEPESALLPVGSYAFLLDWYQNGAFMCNIVESAMFGVVDKLIDLIGG